MKRLGDTKRTRVPLDVMTYRPVTDPHAVGVLDALSHMDERLNHEQRILLVSKPADRPGDPRIDRDVQLGAHASTRVVSVDVLEASEVDAVPDQNVLVGAANAAAKSLREVC